MYKLVGICNGHYPEDYSVEDDLAVFSTYEKAINYVEKSFLKNGRKTVGPCHVYRRFKATSLLRPYCEYKIRECSTLPIDPTI